MCATLAASPSLAARFGYDSGFVIDNPVAFADAICKTLNSSDPNPRVRSHHGACYYHDGAIWSRLRFFDFDSPKQSHNISLMALSRANSKAKYYVKSHRFAHQCEYRFIWEMPDDVTNATLIECPEARYYCREL